MRYALCGHSVDIDDDERLVFSRDDIRVKDIVRYYVAVWPWIEPYLRDRPIVYETFFTTISSPNTFEQDPPPDTPRWVKRAHIAGRERDVTYVIADSPATLVYLVKLRMVTLHVWMSTRKHIEQPDFALFDLDPVGEVAPKVLASSALHLRETLEDAGIASALVKLSGRGGLHVIVPLVPELDYAGVRSFVDTIARAAAERYPKHFTLEREIEKRPRGNVYIDARQVGRGMTIVPPFSLRACEGAPVSMPVAWHDVERWLRSRARALPSVPMSEAIDRLAQRGDPWEWKPVRLSALS